MADEADLFIIEHAGTMTTREMAELLGVNQSTVCRRAKKLGVSPGRRGRRGRRAGEAAPRREAPPAEADDWMERMVDLRSRLKAALDTCGDKDVARIAKEYRAVCDAIRREEGSDDDSGGGFENIIAMLS